MHALPLFHVHGLVIATLGTLRRGGEVRHLGAFDPAGVAAALGADATMLFAVPTMYHRLADAAQSDPAIARGLRGARLLVSGSAALPAAEHARIEALLRSADRRALRHDRDADDRLGARRRRTARRLRRAGARRRRGARRAARTAPICPPTTRRSATSSCAGPSLFDGYLGRPDATAEAHRDGWFATGDLGTLAPDGYLRLVGRRSTDLIKSGGYRIGAGEIEGALLEHPAVAEAAVLGVPDEDLGERIVAWVVTREGASRRASTS